MFKPSLTLCTVLLFSFSLWAQNNFFTDAGANRMIISNGQRVITPQHFRSAALDVNGMKNFLWSLPAESRMNAQRTQSPVLSLPMPDGSIARFRVWESPVMAPGLMAKYPGIKTFAGQGIDDPYATIRLDYNPYFGFHAQVLSPVMGRYFIDPYARGDVNNYISYFAKDNPGQVAATCELPDEIFQAPGIANRPAAGPCRGTSLKTYRLALACTGEYSEAVAGPNPTKAAVLAAIVTSVNRVTGVYETEVAIRLELIANNTDIIYLDNAGDPYTNSSGSAMLSQNQTNLDNVIGTSNYDIGHVFSTGGGGVATLNSPCNPTSKARGVTGLSNPVGDAFDIDFVAHEMGHQFGAPHSFNSVTGGCSGNRSSSDAYEVGSGTTIMSYAGLCSSDNIQPNSDPFFHTISFDRISSFVETGGGSLCGVSTPNGNTLPVITSMENNGVSIPISTPFTLTGSATDANGDAITYCWEEWDLGPSTSWNGGNANTTSPLFKSREPKASGSRTFPDMNVILFNYPANPSATMGGLKGETLPSQARTMKFRLTVRDNRAGGGGVVTGGEGCQAGFTSLFTVNAVATPGPFAVIMPNGSEIFPAGSSQTITWDVVGTNAAPINVSNVRILLSTDGGQTYPTILSASTANDGSELLAFPNIITNSARVKIEAIGNIFFDISNNSFSLTPPPTGFEFSTPAPAVSPCPAGTSMSVNLGTISTGGFSNPINLTAAGNPAGTTVSFSPNPVIPGNNSTVTLNGTNILIAGTYTITITGTVTGAITKTRNLVFTINPGAGPVISNQPTDQVICAGANTSFTIVSPDATSFQWQVSSDGGVNFSNITNGGVYSGATSATLNFTGATVVMNNYRYRAIVSLLCGSTISSSASLTINPSPAVTTPPQSITLCAGSNHSFGVIASGAGLSYQWQLSTNTGGTWNDIPGATSVSYTINSITAGMNNNQYRVIVAGTCAPAATSPAATLTVVTPVTITTQPANIEVCSGSNAIFTVTGNSSQAISYQWQVSTNGGGTWTNINGATASSYTVNNTTTALSGNQYRVLLSNATCASPTTSDAAILTVRQLPTITLGSPASLRPGQTATLTAVPSTSTGGTLTVTWTYNNNPLANTGNSYAVNVEKAGDYKVRIQETWTSGLVCATESAVVTIAAPASDRLFVFPSPNDGVFTVSYYNSSGNNSKRTITLYDSHGAKVYHAQITVSGAYTLVPVNIKPAARGIYYIVVGDANGKRIAKGNVVVH